MAGLSKETAWESRKKFDWLIAFMVLNDPFAHEILMLMDIHPTTQVNTLGVEVKEHGIVLNYNPKYFDGLSVEEARYVFQHEVFHVALHHCTKRLPSDPGEMKIFNIACDLAVNSLIQENSGVKAPKGILHPKNLKLEVGLSVEQYMDILRNQQEQKQKPSPGKGKGEPKDDDEDQPSGKGQHQPGDKKQPGGQGQPGDEEGENEEGDGEGEGGNQFDDHSKWAESEIVDQDIRDTIEYIKNSNKWGSIGGDAQSIIEAAQKPQVNWRGLLRRFLGQIPSPYTASTYKKPNRRYGYPMPGKRREHLDKALFAIDTSGSITDENLSQFLAELNRYVEQYPADLVLFDTCITYGPKPFNKKNPRFTFTGRGGTDPSEIFDLAEERGYKSVVFLTDGQFATPRQPVGVDVVWVITEDGSQPVPWGKFVQLQHKPGRRRK